MDKPIIMRLNLFMRNVALTSIASLLVMGTMLSTMASAHANTPENAQPAVFDLLELRVKGNTVLEKKELERMVYPFLGPKKSYENVEKARLSLEKLYRDKGYPTVYVDIPEQNINKGVVYLQVVEGKVARLRVKGAEYFSLEQIKAGMPELAEGNVPNSAVVQKQLAALSNQSPDRLITPSWSAGDEPGTTAVDLKVKDTLPLHARVEINGRNTSSTSLTRLVSTMHYDNLWQKMHSVSLMYMVSPQNSQQVEVWKGGYDLPLFDSAAKLSLYVLSSSSNTVVAAGSDLVLGAGDTYGARLSRPLPAVGIYSHNLTLGLDHKYFKQNISALTGISTIQPISYLPFMLQYGGMVKQKEALTVFNAGVVVSMRGVGNNQTEFTNKSSNPAAPASASFTIFKGDFSHTHELPLGMQFFGRMNGQIADGPLINNEQLSQGGMLSVRGYFETQALVDRGVVGSVELRSPHLAPLSMDSIDKLQALLFVDGSEGWIMSPTAAQVASHTANYNLASAGFGSRFRMLKYLTGALDVGFPILSLQTIQSGEPKIHFNVGSEF